MARFIGRPIPRLEDRRLIRGQGRYTDDLTPGGAVWAYMLRAPHAHASILAIESNAAAALPGVRAILTAADYRADGNKPIAHHVNGPDATEPERHAFEPTPDSPVVVQPQPVLAEDRVRFVGEIVAMVVADTLEQARDAAELVAIDYAPLPAVTNPLAAIAPGAPQLWDAAPRNCAFETGFGDRAATERALAEAAVVVRHDFINPRIVACQMEPRSAFARYDAVSRGYEVVAGGQGVVRQRMTVAACLGVANDKVHFTTPDTGGGFGSRTSLNPEPVLVAWASQRIGKPVRWLGDRSECFLSDYQGRDLLTRAALGLDRDGLILAIACEQYANLGAHTVTFAPLANGYRLVSTVYDVPRAWVGIHAVLTNTAPVAPYRGAGRPEATFVLERLLDMAAARLGIDRIELRRRNLVDKSKLPYRNVMGLTYDSGDFGGNMEQALARADWAGFAARRAASRARGLLRGIGIGNYVEAPVGALRERVLVRVGADGTVELRAGTQSTGQGHETVFAQVAAERLGLDMEAIRLVTGDSNVIEVGGGTHSDRSMRLVGMLLVEACDKILAEAREAAAKALDCLASDLRFEDGRFQAARSNRSLDLAEIVRANGPLEAAAEVNRRVPAHPTGSAVCELELDPETGTVRILRYTSIDDVGQPINPLIVDGQVHGGIAQGLGEALCEMLGLDTESGQITGGSFMDYCLPRADLLPSFDIALAEDPTSGNPLRVKGGGECGITPATATVVNALVDALQDYGIEHVELPATPLRLWETIRRARERRQASEPKLAGHFV